MENFIKYKRIEETIKIDEINIFLDNLIRNNFQIIYWNETKDNEEIKIITVVGKCGSIII